VFHEHILSMFGLSSESKKAVELRIYSVCLDSHVPWFSNILSLVLDYVQSDRRKSKFAKTRPLSFSLK
jgi:hypothetical protein